MWLRPLRALPLRLAVSFPLTQRALHASARTHSDEFRINDLLAKFKNPGSPYYLAPGEVGPASPEDHSVSRPLAGQDVAWVPPPFRTRDRAPKLPHMDGGYDRVRATVHEWFDSNGFDAEGRVEWPVAWGDSDMYRHINNVSYCRYVESARMKWIESLVPDLGEVGEDYLVREVSAALTAVRAPHRLHPQRAGGAIPLSRDVPRLGECRLLCYPASRRSLAAHPAHNRKQAALDRPRPRAVQDPLRDVVAQSESAGAHLRIVRIPRQANSSTCTIYDFDKLQKGVMSDAVRDVLRARAAA
ncbi:uncharacterized protein COLE_00256 [Cutaneotrichosporon oleaginosum]|uniref:uncharacterized protein n=1 Tax=Cutaneotrichosporon oleaginosum TaxID=879819 RepID=UPI001323A266|nr:hypothetical protein COLE_00256 [Cutaneotrichosporon oleaginosum]